MIDRNPYVMLSIPFGSPRDVATRSFARKAKGKRRSLTPEAKAELTDLTWALNQASEAILDPRVALRTTQSSDAEWARLLDAARAEAVAALHEEIASTAALPER